MESLWGVTYGNSTFVVVGDNETGGVGTLLASSDGTTWTSRTSGTTPICRFSASQSCKLQKPKYRDYGESVAITLSKGSPQQMQLEFPELNLYIGHC